MNTVLAVLGANPMNGERAVRFLRSLAIIAGLQAVFWLATTTLLGLSPLNQENLDRFTVRDVLAAQATSPSDPTPITAFRKSEVPEFGSAGRIERPGVFRSVVNIETPEKGFAVFVTRIADRGALYVNGKPLAGPNPFENMARRQGLVGQYFEIPAWALKSGTNTIDLLVDRDCCRAVVLNILAGPIDEIKPIASLWMWLRLDLLVILVTIATVLCFSAAALLPLRQNRDLIWATIATTGALAIGTFAYVDQHSPVVSVLRGAYGTLFGGVLSYCAYMALVTAWTNGPAILYRVSIILGALAFLLTGAVSAVAHYLNNYDIALHAVRWTALVYSVLTVPIVLALLARHIWHARTFASLEAAILLLPVVVAMDELASALLGHTDPVLLAPLSSLVLLLAIGFGLTRRTGETFYATQDANLTLTNRIAAKEQELEASSAALRAQEAETAIQTERARIMRDMHDGMGGQLLTLLMQARDRDAKPEEMEETIETAIADLRLLIDSLDTVGDDLEIALALFRERLAPRLSASQVTLNWPNGSLGSEQHFEPAAILSIYRILQEAISNALRHGHPNTINVRQQVDDGHLSITIQDDGAGMATSAQSGRGLTNMRRRAKDLHGRLLVESPAEGGVRIKLELPMKAG